MVLHRILMVADGGDANSARGEPRRDGLKQRDNRGKNGVKSGNDVIPPHAAIGFGRILHRLDVIADRDDREENEDEHGQSNQLHTTACAVTQPKAQPQHTHRPGQR